MPGGDRPARPDLPGLVEAVRRLQDPATGTVDPRLAAALRGYLDHLAVERGVARNTLLSYRRDLRRYLLFLAARGRASVTGVIAAPTSPTSSPSLRTGTDAHPPLAASSAARAVVAVRGWHRFLLAEGVVGDRPVAGRPPARAGPAAAEGAAGRPP